MGRKSFGLVVLWTGSVLGAVGLGALLSVRRPVEETQELSRMKSPANGVATTKPSATGAKETFGDSLTGSPPGWILYQNDQYKVRFYYPPYLTIEHRDYNEEALASVSFIGKDCASIPVIERGHTPSLYFWVTKKKEDDPEASGLMPDGCSRELGPNCRSQAVIRPVPLSTGFEATLTKKFGVSGDGTDLTIVQKGRDYVLGSHSGPVPCGSRYDYTAEVFQIANTLTFTDQVDDKSLAD